VSAWVETPSAGKTGHAADPRPWGKPAIQVTPDFIAAFSAKPAMRSTCEDYRELIEQELARGRNGKAIWQDLVSEQGYTGTIKP
jgi:hypothetical protein